jgi:2,4-dienoyl-CoA reductase-like NADH-dependent reductase (Old Yellow Enzyme family)/thioredoxin reductase
MAGEVMVLGYMNKDLLFQPFKLGYLTIPNRVVMTTVKLGYSNNKGEVNQRHTAFYKRRAEGKVGLITSEPMYIQRNGRELPTQLGIYSDELIPGLRQLTGDVHSAGGHIMAHINHAGRVANPKLVPDEELVSASDVRCPVNQVRPNPLTREGIADIVWAFSAAARRVRESGFDAIEIPFSHGYLIHQFLSRHTNQREDEYGGSLKNRLHFGREVITAVRNQVGDDYPIIVRMNARDYVKGGLEIDDAIEIARALEEMGVQALSVTSGTMCESVPYCLYPTGTPKANLLPMAARIREAVSLPVIVAGRIRSPELAREALAANQTDLIGLGRPFLADPDWVCKTENGDEESILLCAACHQGCLAELRKGEGTHCVFNPLTGRESEIQITPAAQPRDIMVVGGGPAGLEAATVAAQRGHHVTLFEQEKRLGGQFALAAKAVYKEEFNDIIDHMVLIAQRAGVEIHLNRPVDPKMVLDSRFDTIILATGGIPLTVPFPGLESTRWLLASDLMDGIVDVETPTALVIGGGLVGLEAAELLATRGVQVTLIKRRDNPGGDMDILARNMLLKRLQDRHVELHINTKIQRLTADTLIAQQGGQEVRFPIETVVIAVGVRANRELPDALTNSDLEIYTIGDAVEPRQVKEAIWEGFEIGIKV